MNIWAIQFDFDLSHIFIGSHITDEYFIGDVATDEYMGEGGGGVRANVYDPLYSSVNRRI
jgi:hypothetical protein